MLELGVEEMTQNGAFWCIFILCISKREAKIILRQEIMKKRAEKQEIEVILLYFKELSRQTGVAVNLKPLEIADPGVCDFLGNCKPLLIYCIHIFIMEAQALHK